MNKDGKCAYHAANVSPEEHRAFRIRCVETGVGQSEVIRALVKAWVSGSIDINFLEKVDDLKKLGTSELAGV